MGNNASEHASSHDTKKKQKNKTPVNAILGHLFPNFTCLACNDEINTSARAHICDTCFAHLKHSPSPQTKAEFICDNADGWHFQTVFAPFEYAPPLSQLIMSLKYSGEGLVAELFAPLIAQHITERYDLIIPVPLARSRLRQRGYNQAELIARSLCSALSVPLSTSRLARIRKTKPQVDMTTQQRRENQRGAFTASGCKDMRILLVDDVMTSGATANECARVLRDAGAVYVDVAVIARVA